MTLYPEVQTRAQAELGAVVGLDRLPSLADRPQLPYIEALVKEVLRYGLVAPKGFPHRLRVDDMHNGYFIPKKSLVMPNVLYVVHAQLEYATF